jgi:hypothetical protein
VIGSRIVIEGNDRAAASIGLEPPTTVKAVALPAVAWFLKVMPVLKPFPDTSEFATNFCVNPELFVIPTPLIVSAFSGVDVIEYAFAPGLKVISFTSTSAERERVLFPEAAKLAVSVGPFGTVAGVQLVAVFQSPLVGLRFQVALPANECAAIKHKKT